MPTYGYRCTVCKHEFERFQKMSDPPVAACEECGEPVKKILYPVGIAFKGTGFYINDSKPSPAKSSTAPAATTTETKTETPAADTKTAETKPAETKTESKPAETKPATTA